MTGHEYVLCERQADGGLRMTDHVLSDEVYDELADILIDAAKEEGHEGDSTSG